MRQGTDYSVSPPIKQKRTISRKRFISHASEALQSTRPASMKLGTIFRAARLLQGKTIAEVAQLAGKSISYVGDLETGKKPIQAFAPIATIVGLDPERFSPQRVTEVLVGATADSIESLLVQPDDNGMQREVDSK